MICLRFCILALALVGAACKSWGDIELVGTDYKVRIYAVDGADYPSSGKNSELLLPLKAFPKLSLKQMKALLSNLRFYNYNVFSNKARDVFYESDVDYLAPRLLRALKQLEQIKSKQRLIVIYKNVPPGNLVRTSLRSTMVFWHDKQGLNILIGEIRKPLLSENLVYPYSDWDEAEPIDINEPIEGISLVASPPYQRKQLGKLEHNTWLLLPVSALNSLLPKKKKAKTNKELELEKKQETDTAKDEADAESKANSKAKSKKQ